MAQLAQGLCLDLANALASDVELLAYLFESATATIIKAEAQLQDFALALGQAVQHILHLLFEQLMAGGFRRCQSGVVFDEITKMTIFFLTDWRLQANRFLANLNDFTHLLRRDLHLLRDLLGRRFTAQVLQQTAADANQAVDRL